MLNLERVGNQARYSANRACPVFEELASIVRKTSGLVEVLAGGLTPLAGKIRVAFVFGSMASGKSHADSDIDLMLIGNVGFAEVVALMNPLQEMLGREINPKVYSETEWSSLVKMQSAFIRNVLGKPKLFVIGDEQTLGALEESA